MITELEITNFKAFASATIRFGRYTLLSGLNSSGKSTVLQALALLRQGDNGFDGIPLNGELVELGAGRDVLHESIAAVYANYPMIAFRVASDKYEDADWHFSCDLDADFLQKSHTTCPVFHGEGFQYLRADRVSPAVTYPRSHEMTVRRGVIGAHGEFAADYLLHYQDDLVPEAVRHPAASTGRLLAQAEAWMSEICPGVRIQAEAIDRTDLARLGYQFVSPGQLPSEQRRPTNVGFGLTYVLPVIIACLTAQPETLLLLENPESHIHPQGQSAMARLTCAAAAAGAQVVVETHSDHILNGVRLAVKRQSLSAEDVVLQYFRREDGGIDIVSPAMGPDGMLSEWPAGFFDEWDRSLDQLLDP